MASDDIAELALRLVDHALGIVDSLITQTQTQISTMANELDTFISTQEAANTRISAAVEGVKGDVTSLKEQITQLLKDAPTVEQQEKLRALEVTATGIASKLEALDAETPAVPENVAGLNDRL